MISALKPFLKRMTGSEGMLRFGIRRLRQDLLAVCYHDLTDQSPSASWLKLPADMFERHLQFYRKHFSIIGAGDLNDNMTTAGRKPRLLITFDDGCINNYRIGLPLLRKYEIPALLFLSTSNMTTGKLFWFDILVTPIQALGMDHIDLTDFGLGLFRFPDTDPSLRWEGIQQLLEAIKQKGNPSDPPVKALLDHFQSAYRDVIEAQRDHLRPLTRQEVEEMVESGFCHIGSHGHDHELLPHLDDQPLIQSLQRSRHSIADLTGQPPEWLAYPNGDANDRVVEAARDSGYRWGFTTRAGIFDQEQDQMRIPRLMIGGYDGLSDIRWKILRTIVRRRPVGSALQ